MARFLLACALLVSLASVAQADQTSRLTVDITNRGCILDIAPRSIHGPVLVDTGLALWISPVDAVGPIVKLDVASNDRTGLVRSVDLCGHPAIGAGTYGVTAVFNTPEVDYHHPDALRGTALLTFSVESLRLPPVKFVSPPRIRECTQLGEVAPAPSSNRRAWLIGTGGALLALAVFVLARRRVETFIV